MESIFLYLKENPQHYKSYRVGSSREYLDPFIIFLIPSLCSIAFSQSEKLGYFYEGF